jgi:uncharacterized membrane protein
MGSRAGSLPAAAGTGTDGAMLNRMAIAVLALVGLLISAYMGAYSFGLTGEIVCGSGGCSIVQDSPWARLQGIPVPALGLAGYAALLAAALAGLQPALAARRGISFVLSAGAVVGLGFSAYFTYLEAFVIHAWCRWCVASAVVTVLIFLFTLPELRRLRGPE